MLGVPGYLVSCVGGVPGAPLGVETGGLMRVNRGPAAELVVNRHRPVDGQVAHQDAENQRRQAVSG